MTKLRKIVAPLIVIIIVLLIIFLSKDYIIRKYFIWKLENVDYDEYILEISLNNKKSAIHYYTPEFVMERAYNDSGELDNCIITKDYIKDMEHYYYIDTNEIFYTYGNTKFSKPSNVNNKTLLNFLKNENEYSKISFKYHGIKLLNNQKCYVLEFNDKQQNITIIYLDKELLYTKIIDIYLIDFQEKSFKNSTVKKHIICEYILDLNLKQKSLFE